jgi:hypothetical protein
MRRNIYLFIPILALAAFILSSYSGEDSDYPGGAPAGYTGSPGDGQDCHNCHGGSSSAITGVLTSNIPAQGYTPGSTYTSTITVSGSGKKGFELSPQNASGTQLGTMAAGSGSKLVGGTKYVTQNSAVTTSTATWNVSWTAPAAGTGDVTFYCACVITKPVTKTTTMTVSEYVPFSVTATATPGQICSGSTSQLDATATGGSGNFTYVWTSVPAGFTSTLKNPVVNPTVNTQYNVEVNDGSGTATGSANVSVTDIPTANAGNDTTISAAVNQVPVNGTATNYSSVIWSTSGDGTFGNASALSTTYSLGANDKSSGGVNLTLTANSSGPCTAATDSRHITITSINGIPQAGGNGSLAVLPNPTDGKFCIQIPASKDQSVKVTVFSGTGATVYSQTLMTDASGKTGVIDLQGIPGGVYFVKAGSNVAKVIVR